MHMCIKKVRISDVAKLAGVSSATVSRAINNQSIVQSDTYKKVVAAMTELGYEKSLAFNTASTGCSFNDLIIFSLPSIDNPFYSEITKGAQSAAQRYGRHILIHSGLLEGEGFVRFTEMVKNNRVAGVITANFLTVASLEKLNAITQVVQCCEFCENHETSYVSIDDYHSVKNALDYIFTRGRRNIALINGPAKYKYARHRQRGYLDFLSEKGIPVKESFIVQLNDVNYDIAIAAITQLLSKDDLPDAIFAVSDIYASAAIKVAKKCGLQVPRDLVIVGFDNIDVSVMSEPSITTISQPRFQMGYMACELLLERIANSDVPTKRIILDTELIIRESTMV